MIGSLSIFMDYIIHDFQTNEIKRTYDSLKKKMKLDVKYVK